MSPFFLCVSVFSLPPCIFALRCCGLPWECVFVYCLCACHALTHICAHSNLCFTFCLKPCLFLHVHVSCMRRTPPPQHGLCSVCLYICIYMHVYLVTLRVRVTVGDLVAVAARGGLLTLSRSRGASFYPACRKQTS